MSDVLTLLEWTPTGDPPELPDEWFYRILDSLRAQPLDWRNAVQLSEGLSEDDSWSLLSWVEVAANQLTRSRSQKELETVLYAFALVLYGDLDPRDCSVVASIVRRACEVAGLDYEAAAIRGTSETGRVAENALRLLLEATTRLPSTHQEDVEGEVTTFRRVPHDIDMEWLMRMHNGDQ